MEQNRRAAERYSTRGLMSSIWDGKAACMGVIEDVSATGLRISQVPFHFDDHAPRCFSIVHGPHRDYTVLLQPCWRVETRRGMYKMIGFRVDNPPSLWQEFIKARGEPSDLFRVMQEDSWETAM